MDLSHFELHNSLDFIPVTIHETDFLRFLPPHPFFFPFAKVETKGRSLGHVIPFFQIASDWKCLVSWPKIKFPESEGKDADTTRYCIEILQDVEIQISKSVFSGLQYYTRYSGLLLFISRYYCSDFIYSLETTSQFISPHYSFILDLAMK